MASAALTGIAGRGDRVDLDELLEDVACEFLLRRQHLRMGPSALGRYRNHRCRYG